MFISVPEEKFLQQIRLEELYGPLGNKSIEEEKKALAPKKAAIGFSYDEDPVTGAGGVAAIPLPLPPTGTGGKGAGGKGTAQLEEEKDSDEDSDSDIDLGQSVLFFGKMS